MPRRDPSTKTQELSRDDSVSLHEQIRRSILADIWRGLYNPGDLLPSEKDLSSRFGVNRLTVRQAVHALAHQGHVRPLKGRGYQVRSNVLSADALTVISLSRYLQEVGLETETKLIDRSVVSAVPDVADALGVRPGNDVIRITRLRLVLKSPIVVEEAFYDAEKFDHLLDVDLDHKSLIDTLFREFDLRIGRVAAELKAGLAGERGELLGLPPSSPVLVASIVMYDLDDSPVELGIAYYHSDRARMTVTAPVDPGTWPYGEGLK